MTTTGNIFELNLRRHYAVVRFYGFIDAATVEMIKPALHAQLPEACANIVVDLEKADFLDSHGVGLFVSLLKRAHRLGGKMFIGGIEGQPASVLQMVGFNNTLVTYCPSAQDACALLDPASRTAV